MCADQYPSIPSWLTTISCLPISLSVCLCDFLSVSNDVLLLAFGRQLAIGLLGPTIRLLRRRLQFRRDSNALSRLLIRSLFSSMYIVSDFDANIYLFIYLLENKQQAGHIGCVTIGATTEGSGWGVRTPQIWTDPQTFYVAFMMNRM